MPAAASYLESLNPEQRRAVEHGVAREHDGRPGAPLLVIAGAGSGKTNTLAHRVAHLIVNGADPRRILLMTFSRRAAAEMTRRVERIARKVLGDKRRRHDRRAALGRHLPRHRRAAAARLCRSDRARSRLHHPRSRGFRRPDEPGPARARLLEDREPVSDQGHLPCDLLALRQCRGADRAGAGRLIPLVRRLGGRTEGTVRGLCRGQAEAERARLRRPAALLGADDERSRRSPRRSAAGSTTCWSTSIRTPTGCSPRSCWR